MKTCRTVAEHVGKLVCLGEHETTLVGDVENGISKRAPNTKAFYLRTHGYSNNMKKKKNINTKNKQFSRQDILYLIVWQ